MEGVLAYWGAGVDTYYCFRYCCYIEDDYCFDGLWEPAAIAFEVVQEQGTLILSHGQSDQVLERAVRGQNVQLEVHNCELEQAEAGLIEIIFDHCSMEHSRLMTLLMTIMMKMMAVFC